MKSKLLDQSESRTFVIVFEKGDEAVEQLLSFASDNDLRGSSFTAIGAFSDVTVAFFDRQTKDYQPIRIEEQVEVLSLIGNIAVTDSGPKIHAHLVVGHAAQRHLKKPELGGVLGSHRPVRGRLPLPELRGELLVRHLDRLAQRRRRLRPTRGRGRRR